MKTSIFFTFILFCPVLKSQVTTFNSVDINGTTGNTLVVNTSGIVYDADNLRIGINTTTPAYLFDLWPGFMTLGLNNPFFTLRNNAGNEGFLVNLDINDNISAGLIDADDSTKVKFRTDGISFVKGRFSVGDDPVAVDYPQFKVLGSQNLQDDINDAVAYQMTIQNETDDENEWAALGFGVDANRNRIGGYIGFKRLDDNSFGEIHFGVKKIVSDANPVDILILTGVNVNFPQTTASKFAYFDASKNLMPGTTGAGINLSSGTLIWNPSSYVDNISLWDASNSSRTFTANLSGSTDPVWTYSNNSVDLSTGTLKNNGNAVTTIVGTAIHLTNQTASIGATQIYPVTADGFYQVCWAATITTASTGSTLGPLQIRWTNVADSQVKTTSGLNNYNGSNAGTTTGNGSGIGGVTTVYAKSGTDIQYIMGYSAGAGTLAYSLDITVVKL